jgi:glyceraldehyde-3-phosphate dehydrogenase (NAD(P))
MSGPVMGLRSIINERTSTILLAYGPSDTFSGGRLRPRNRVGSQYYATDICFEKRKIVYLGRAVRSGALFQGDALSKRKFLIKSVIRRKGEGLSALNPSMKGPLMPVRVAVNGYGTIGKRVADAVARQPDMKLVGVAKTRPSLEAWSARERGYPLYLAGDARREDFVKAGLPVAGVLEELLDQCDVVVDCTPERVGASNWGLYEKHRLRAIWQGGEKASVAEHSFNALANYEECRGARRIRVVSCNTTGMARAGALLQREYGIEHWDVTVVRRAADPGEIDRGPINGIIPTLRLPSHHGPDVKTVLAGVPIATSAVVVPTTLMHMHVNHVRLARPPSDPESVRELFRSHPRFLLFPEGQHVNGTPQVIEWARDQGRPRNDVMENVLWDRGINLEGPDLYFFQAIHQESVVVPENVDAIRAMFELETDPLRSIEITDRHLGLRPISGPSRAPTFPVL